MTQISIGGGRTTRYHTTRHVELQLFDHLCQDSAIRAALPPYTPQGRYILCLLRYDDAG